MDRCDGGALDSAKPPIPLRATRSQFGGAFEAGRSPVATRRNRTRTFMTSRTGALDDDIRSASRGRWWQLFVGVLCMSMIANLQYGWTLFVNPISARHGWGRAAIQVAFTLFVLTETWLVPIEGYLVDRFGPRIIVVVA